MKKKVVVIGGGNGSAATIVALKQNIDLFDISAVVSMSDSGGSSGRLREEFDTLPTGDILRAVLAMSMYDYPILKTIFNRNRFSQAGKLKEHNLGNLFLTLTARYCGDFSAAVRALEESVEAQGSVYPATLDKTHLSVELSNGKVINREHKIDNPAYNRKNKIVRAWLDPAGKAPPQVKKVIKEADYVILAPGSLYTSVVAALLPVGIRESINSSKATLISVTQNSFEADGETGPECLSERVRQLEEYLPRKVNVVIYNNKKLDAQQEAHYDENKWTVMEKDEENLAGRKVIGADFERDEGGMCAIKLGNILKKILSK